MLKVQTLNIEGGPEVDSTSPDKTKEVAVRNLLIFVKWSRNMRKAGCLGKSVG